MSSERLRRDDVRSDRYDFGGERGSRVAEVHVAAQNQVVGANLAPRSSNTHGGAARATCLPEPQCPGPLEDFYTIACGGRGQPECVVERMEMPAVRVIEGAD